MKFQIARDLDGTLCLYKSKPYLDMYNDWDSDDDYLVIDKNQFPEVTFENSPMEVELKISKGVMKHEEIEAYLKSRDLDAMQYQLAMDAMCYAENTIIEKACKWFNDNLYTTYDMFNNIGIDNVDGYTVEKLIEEFKKAMKNENSI